MLKFCPMKCDTVLRCQLTGPGAFSLLMPTHASCCFLDLAWRLLGAVLRLVHRIMRREGRLASGIPELLFAGMILATQMAQREGTEKRRVITHRKYVLVQNLLLASQQESRVRKGRSHDTPGLMARLTSPASLLAMSSAPTLVSARDMLFLQGK